MTVTVDDKRLYPAFGPVFWSERVSEREWSRCRFCYRDVPTFLLYEGRMGEQAPESVLRCCWECGAGIEEVP